MNRFAYTALAGALLFSFPATAEEAYPERVIATDPTDGLSFRVLVPEEVKRLEITPAPTDPGVPLIIGTFWRCESVQPNPFTDETFDICRLKLVVCTDEGDFCVES